MDLRKAEQLVRKYYAGETSAQEEKALREYMETCKDLPEYFAPEKELFTMYSRAADSDIPATGYMENLEKLIEEQGQKRVSISKPVLHWVSGIAAGLAILVGSYLMVLNKHESRRIALKDTYTDPQQAYEEARKVLLYVSEKMNEGTSPLAGISKMNQSMENLQKLNNLNKGVSSLQMLNLLKNNEKNN